MRFEFLAPHRIVFGPGVAPGAPDAAASLGTRAFVITGGDPDRAAWLFKACAEKRLPTVQFSVRGAPTLAAVRAGTAAARGARCDVIIAVGGGSVLDSGKAIAAVLSNGGDPLDYRHYRPGCRGCPGVRDDEIRYAGCNGPGRSGYSRCSGGDSFTYGY